MNDPIADLINRIKNAGAASKESTSIPYSNLKWVVAEKLKEKGFVKNVEKKGKVYPRIEIEVAYDDLKKPRIRNAARVSKLSRRIYKGYKEIRPVRHGHGVLIISTPAGVMTGEEAVKAKIGGEVLCTIW